jgi:hypothetical protein
MIKNVYLSSVGHQLILSDCNETRIFPTDFRKVLKYKILLKSVQWELSCFLWTEGQT